MAQAVLSRAWQRPSAFLLRRARIRTRPSPSLSSFGTTRLVSPHQDGFWSKNSRRYLAATSRSVSSYEVGDAVLIDVHKDQSKLVPGVIEEIRKAGWYAVRNEETATIQKVRKSQLVMNDAAANDEETVLDLTSIMPDNLPVQEPVQALPALTLEVDAPNEYPVDPEAPPPPPKMDHLDALVNEFQQDPTLLATANATHKEYLQQLQHHASVNQWVVFTDLHCAPSTLDTCLAILKKVHKMARDRQAGVLFLGDFWHHRGTLRVDCLNAVLQEFREWTVPMILIPGNHDQVTLGGHSHGLTPLEHAYRVNNDTTTVPGPLVFSHPTLFAGALWVPHVRDIGTLESILQSDLARNQAEAVFVHADVTGAYMNDLIVSTKGVHPAAFPPNKPIYSGHFHKPHTVTSKKHNVVIEYLGSPYEVTLAEAHQDKALVVLDASQQWKCVERIPLSIGRKHYKPHSIDELMDLGLSGDYKTMVRQGDRIVATLPREEFLELEDPVEDHIRMLRKTGVAVEVREDADPNAAVPAIAKDDAPDFEDLSPTSTWERFWEEQLQRGVIKSEAVAELKEAGLALLEEIDQDEQSSGTRVLSTTATNLQFDSVSVEGYGPFSNRVEYPLNNRGLVLLRGSNLDGGSDSNGSGKTSLAMAALWALTGSSDPRPVQDNKVSDVVNDLNKNARVTVNGHVNGKPFSITRTKSPKASGLAFILDGQDVTTQSAKETMVVIEERLGVSAPVLARTMFHGQHALNELLEATDAKLKEELSLIVPLQLWQAAATFARSKRSKATKKENELEGMASLRMDDLERLKERCQKAATDLSTMEKALEAKEAELEAHKHQQLIEGSEVHIDWPDLDILREGIVNATVHLDETKSQIRRLSEERDSEIQVVSKRLSKQMMSAKEATKHHQQVRLDYQSSTQQVKNLQIRVGSLETRWQVDLSSGELPTGFTIPDKCPTCLQPVSNVANGVSSTHDHHNLQAKAEEEIKETLHELISVQTSLSSTKRELSSARLLQEEGDAELLVLEEELKGKTKHWDESVSHAAKGVAYYQEQISSLTSSLAANAERLQQAGVAESRLESEVSTAQEALRFAKDTSESLEAALDSMAVEVGKLRAQLKEQKHTSRQMSGLSDAFGNRGIQTFVLQNSVKDLQSLTQNYLDDFSDGAQRLELSLDAGDKITRQASVRETDGSFRERPLATLSGGQWRRCSLALTLGFADLVATRGGLRPSLIVLDEPLTHLDRAGRSDVGKVLRKILGQQSDLASSSHGYSNFSVSTIILILQDLAAEELEEAFDRMDEVVKQNGASSVKVDEDE